MEEGTSSVASVVRDLTEAMTDLENESQGDNAYQRNALIQRFQRLLIRLLDWHVSASCFEGNTVSFFLPSLRNLFPSTTA